MFNDNKKLSYLSLYQEIDTPALLIDSDLLTRNIGYMQAKASDLGVFLRPHIKTHKSNYIAKLQIKAGAVGIAAAKIGEAEVLARAGIKDILIANQIVGENKLERIKKLSQSINVSFGLDSIEALNQAEKVFCNAEKKAQVLIEINSGENRSGVDTHEYFIKLLAQIKKCKHIEFLGVYSHEGFTYNSQAIEECLKTFEITQNITLEYASLAKNAGFECKIISVGATPTALLCTKLKDGITEMRPGTYVLMDMGQSNAIGTRSHCAATILSTIISKPSQDRIVSDVGAKGLTMQSRQHGICKTNGLGLIKGTDTYISNVYDEHAIIYDENLSKTLSIGDKIEIIPNHICPVSNLYDKAYLVSKGKIIKAIKISARGQMT